MSAGKKFLLFFFGMITGIVLFVGAIIGAVYAIIATTTVGDVQDGIIKTEIIDKESDMYNTPLVDAISQVIGDMSSGEGFSMKSLYEKYGIKLLNEIEGIDLSQKSFYATPLGTLLENPSQIIEGLSLEDITKIANINIDEINLPILNDNLHQNVNIAVENILGSINGDMSIRSINDKFGIDLGVQDNELLASLQDVSLSNFGNVVNAVRLSTILDVDTDTFVKYGANTIYVSADEYVAVSKVELANKSYAPPKGVETFFDNAKDTNNDGTADTLDVKELRYIQKTAQDGSVSYVVDNSCYASDFDANTNEITYYRHVIYKEYTYSQSNPPADTVDLYVECFYNHIVEFNSNNYNLLSAGFQSLKDFYVSDDNNIKATYRDAIKTVPTLVSNGKIWIVNNFYIDNNEGGRELTSIYSVIDETIDEDCVLSQEQSSTRDNYVLTNIGTSQSILQNIAHLTLNELQDADDMFENLYIADVVKVNEHSARILRSLVARNCTIGDLGNVAGQLSLGEMIEIKVHDYAIDLQGQYVRIVNDSSLVPYDSSLTSMSGLDRFNADGTANANGDYVYSHYFTLFNPALHGDQTRFARVDNPDADSQMLQRFAFSKLEADSFDALVLGDVLDIEIDTYVAVDEDYAIAHKDSQDFFYYDVETNIYKRWDGSATTNTLYRIVKEGDNKAILKKIAYCSIGNLATSMETAISDMTVSELVEINAFSEIELDNNLSIPDDKENTYYYFRPYGIDDSGREYTFVYDIHGKFMLRNYVLNKVSEGVSTGTKAYFKYTNITSIESFATSLANHNVFYYNESANEYVFNIPLCSYLAMRGDFTHIYTRESASEGDLGSIGADTYTMGSLYVNINGTYVAYDSNNITHHALDEYYQYDAGNFIVPISQKGLTAEYDVQDYETTFSMRYCDKVYIQDANGLFVCINDKYVPFDSDVHASSLPRFREEIGYVGKYLEAYDGEESVFNTLITLGDGSDIMSKVKSANKIQSVPILRYFAKQNTNVENMNEVLDTAQLKDIMDIEPNSIFSQFGDSTLSSLSKDFSSAIPNMTIGQMIEWGSITDVDADVLVSLKHVTLTNFFQSLTVSESGIILDMEIALGYKSK